MRRPTSVAWLVCLGLVLTFFVGAPASYSADYPPDPPPGPPAVPTVPTDPTVPSNPIPRPIIVEIPPAGDATVTLGGEQITIPTSNNPRAGAIEVDGEGYFLRVASRSPDGNAVPLNGNETIVVNAGGFIVTSGSGFVPSPPPVSFYLQGPGITTPRLVGTLPVQADGTFAGSVPIPADLAPGVYSLQMTALSRVARLRAEAPAQVIQITVRVIARPYTADTRTVRGSVFFTVLSAQLTPEARADLRRLVKRLPDRNGRRVTVVGFVAPGGPSYNNRSLSRARADAVVGYLATLGVTGAFRPIAGGLSGQNGAAGRRADVAIAPRR